MIPTMKKPIKKKPQPDPQKSRPEPAAQSPEPPNPGSQPEFTEETAIAFFARHLDELKWQYHRYNDQPVLFCGFNGVEALWDFNMVARAKNDGQFLLCISSFIPNKARPDRRVAVAEMLSRINWELTMGCFEMNHADGEIRFRTSVMLPGADITDVDGKTPLDVATVETADILRHHRAKRGKLPKKLPPGSLPWGGRIPYN